MILCNHSPRDFLGSINKVFAPMRSSHFRTTSVVNSGPLSERFLCIARWRTQESSPRYSRRLLGYLFSTLGPSLRQSFHTLVVYPPPVLFPQYIAVIYLSPYQPYPVTKYIIYHQLLLIRGHMYFMPLDSSGLTKNLARPMLRYLKHGTYMSYHLTLFRWA